MIFISISFFRRPDGGHVEGRFHLFGQSTGSNAYSQYTFSDIQQCIAGAFVLAMPSRAMKRAQNAAKSRNHSCWPWTINFASRDN
jgi:hypothetical protein